MAQFTRDLPRNSVVTPSLNQGEVLEATLRSVIAQRYPELEYVVIDGGSDDESVGIIERHEDDLAYWTSERDRGHSDALDKGFAKTSGEIMCWINSSDMYFPWTFETVAQVFQQFPQIDWITGTGSMSDMRGQLKIVIPNRGVNAFDILAGDYHGIQQESVFWRRRLWEKAGGRVNQELTCAADLDLWLRFFDHAALYHVETLLGGFRVHENRLGEASDDLYGREATHLLSRFISTKGRRALMRARLIRLVGSGRRRLLAEGLGRAGLLPWYRHPRVTFEFESGTWILH